MKTENSFKLLGTLAIERGWLTKKQLEDSIDQQINSPLKLGEILIGKGESGEANSSDGDENDEIR